jgi:hypothetical protein
MSLVRRAACCLVVLAALAVASPDGCVSIEKEKDAVCLLGFKAACRTMTQQHAECAISTQGKAGELGEGKDGKVIAGATKKALFQTGYQEGLKQGDRKSFYKGYQEGRTSATKKVRNPACSGWAPKTGEYAGIGSSCTSKVAPPGDNVRWADWCWTSKDYKGTVGKRQATKKINGETVYFSMCPQKRAAGLSSKQSKCPRGSFYKITSYSKPVDFVRLHNAILGIVGGVLNVVFPTYRGLAVRAEGEPHFFPHEAFARNKKTKERHVKKEKAAKKTKALAHAHLCKSIKSASDKKCDQMCKSPQGKDKKGWRVFKCIDECSECEPYRKKLNVLGETEKYKQVHIGTSCCRKDMDLPTSAGFPSCWGRRNSFLRKPGPDPVNDSTGKTFATPKCVAFHKAKKGRSVFTPQSVLGEAAESRVAERFLGNLFKGAKDALKSVAAKGVKSLIPTLVKAAPKKLRPAIKKIAYGVLDGKMTFREIVKIILDTLMDNTSGLKKSHRPFLEFAAKSIVKCMMRKEHMKCFKAQNAKMWKGKKSASILDSSNEFLGYIRNMVLLKVLKINPCSFECIGEMQIHSVFDAFHKTFAWLPGQDPNAAQCHTPACEEAYVKNMNTKGNKKEVEALYDFKAKAEDAKKIQSMDGKAAYDADEAAHRFSKLADWSKKTRVRLGLNAHFGRSNSKGKAGPSETPGINWLDLHFSQLNVWPNLNKKGSNKPGLGLYPKFKTVEDLLDSSARTVYIGRFSKIKKKMSAKPVCKMSVTYYVATCSTCCCVKGLLQVFISTKLLHTTGGHSCTTWFNLNDAMVRAHIGLAKSLDSVGQFVWTLKHQAGRLKGKTCFGA